MIWQLRFWFLLLMALPAAAEERPPPADPLTAEIQIADSDRFAQLFADTHGSPSAQELQDEYLDPGSYGITVFTPNRIIDSKNLAKAIAKDPEAYATTITTCLPIAKAANSDLRSIYLGMRGALPEVKLPQVYVVIGAGNSGGTAAPGAQVLGLETLCKLSDSPEDLRKTLRHFFAHETVHALQQDAGLTFKKDALLHNILAEGAADFIARLVTGEEPDPARDAWAQPREAELWKQFLADIELTREAENYGDDNTPEGAALRRWIGNYDNSTDGRPSELGYWIGLKIWERYYAAASDKQAALQEMLLIGNPRQILEMSPYSIR